MPSRNIIPQQPPVVSIPRPARRLERKHIIPPPRPARPPQRAGPHVRIQPQMLQQPLDGALAQSVRPAGELAQQTQLAVRAQPRRGAHHPLHADLGRDAVLARAGAVAVEILMHLVDDLVLGVRERHHVLVRHVPRPGAGPLVPLHEDVLAPRASGADAVDGRLVELQDEVLAHGVVLVVGVEDHALVGGELAREVGEEGLEVRGRGDDTPVEAAVVVGVRDGPGAQGGDGVDGGGEVLEVLLREGGGEGVGGEEALHREGDAEHVVALGC